MPHRADQRPFLDRLEVYLSRRDGVDKLLKIGRYTCQILVASPLLAPKDPVLASRLKEFEASVGLSRKALRLGKFVQDLNALRTVPSLRLRDGILEAVASGGEGVYYFIEQFIWLMKAGLLDKRHQKRLENISAWAEFIGYLGSISLKSLQIRDLIAKESSLSTAIEKGKDTLEGASLVQTVRKLAELRRTRLLKNLSIIQDFADALLALSDIRDSNGVLSNPIVLSSCGLLSALISAHKNWSVS